MGVRHTLSSRAGTDHIQTYVSNEGRKTGYGDDHDIGIRDHLRIHLGQVTRFNRMAGSGEGIGKKSADAAGP